jgi:hypothetical protein
MTLNNRISSHGSISCIARMAHRPSIRRVANFDVIVGLRAAGFVDFAEYSVED